MPLDGISSTFLVKELRYHLVNARVDRIYQPDRFSLLIYFYHDRQLKKLYLSANPSAAALYLTTRETENPKTPPNFCMLLRKHLIGGRLLDIEQPQYERVFNFKFLVLNELGDPETKSLVVEIMGRHSNIILLNRERKIHDSIIHVDHEMSSVREIMPARTYHMPPSQDKQSIDFFADQRFEILPFLEEPSSANIEKSLLNHVQGFSPLIARAIIADSDLENRAFPEQLRVLQKKQLTIAVYKVIDMILAGADQPTLYFRSDEDTKPYEFHAFELKALPFRKTVDSLSLAMDVFYSLQTADLHFGNQKQILERKLNKRIKHTQKKMELHQQDFAEGQTADELQKIGELLNSQLYLVKKAAEEVELIDYYDPLQKPLKVKLKGHLSPAENAALYFKRYRKAKSKFQSSRQLLREDQAELQWLLSLMTALDKAENITDLEAIHYEISLLEKTPGSEPDEHQESPAHLLQNALNPGKPGKKRKKYTSSKNRKQKNSAKKEKPLPPREFHLSDGIVVYVGRNNLQNDYLSLQKASPDDLWFHVKDLTGAHVLLQAEDASRIEPVHIEKAAQIAAWYSEANQIKSGHGGKIAVDSCLAKYVRKAKGAKPGMVIYDHHKTYFVKAQLPAGQKT